MEHPDEGTMHAWLDDALTAPEAAQFDAHMASCGACRAAVAEARGLIAASSRIVASLDDVPARVVPMPARAARGVTPIAAPRAVRRWGSRSGLAAAAALFVAVGTYAILPRINRPDASPVSDTRVSAETAPAPAPTPAATAEAAPAEATMRTIAPAAPVASAKASVPNATMSASRRATASDARARSVGALDTTGMPAALIARSEVSSAPIKAAAPPPRASAELRAMGRADGSAGFVADAGVGAGAGNWPGCYAVQKTPAGNALARRLTGRVRLTDSVVERGADVWMVARSLERSDRATQLHWAREPQDSTVRLRVITEADTAVVRASLSASPARNVILSRIPCP